MSAFIDCHRERFGVELICQTIGVSASAYYHRATGQRSARAVEDERLVEVIRRVHRENFEAYGYRRMWKALAREGEVVARCRVQRLMAQEGLQGAKRRGRPWRTTTPGAIAERASDLVQRDFAAPAPDRLWVCDFTYLRCWEGLVFFSFVIDVFSRRIVGWQLASHMRTDLVLDALRMALGQRAPGADVALVHHSDPAASTPATTTPRPSTMPAWLASVGTTGDAYDNALAESFVDTFKTELISDRVWRTRAQLELAVVEYVGWFNHRRLHEALGDVPPVEFELEHALAAPSATARTDAQLPFCRPSNPVSVEPGPAQTPARLAAMTARGETSTALPATTSPATWRTDPNQLSGARRKLRRPGVRAGRRVGCGRPGGWRVPTARRMVGRDRDAS